MYPSFHKMGTSFDQRRCLSSSASAALLTDDLKAHLVTGLLSSTEKTSRRASWKSVITRWGEG
jgi:hypothetical protein